MFTIEYLDDNTVFKKNFTVLKDAFKMVSSLLMSNIRVLRISGDKQFIYFINDNLNSSKIISFDEYLLLKKGEVVIKSNCRLKCKNESIIEVLYPKNKIIRFPSIHDYMCYIHSYHIYNFHEFVFQRETLKYLDDNIIEYESTEDIFYLISLEEVIQESELVPINKDFNYEEEIENENLLYKSLII